MDFFCPLLRKIRSKNNEKTGIFNGFDGDFLADFGLEPSCRFGNRHDRRRRVARGGCAGCSGTEKRALRRGEHPEKGVAGVLDNGTRTALALFANTGRAGVERERTRHGHDLSAHSRCWRFAHQRNARRSAAQFTRRPMRFLGEYEQLCIAARFGADSAWRGCFDEWRRSLRRNGGSGLEIARHKTVGGTDGERRLVQHLPRRCFVFNGHPLEPLAARRSLSRNQHRRLHPRHGRSVGLVLRLAALHRR